MVDRDFAGVSISQVNGSTADAWFKTDQLLIHVQQTSVPPPPSPAPVCDAIPNSDISSGDRVSEYPNGISNVTQNQCCTKCGSLKVRHTRLVCPALFL